MGSSAAIRVAVFHNEPFVKVGLVETLRRQPDFAVASSLADHHHLDWLAHSRADVVVADYDSALTLLSSAHQQGGPHAALPKVLILSGRDTESEIRHALQCGVRGYQTLGGKPDDLFDGMRLLHRGVHYLCPVAACRLAESVAGRELTERESDVLRLVTEGCCNKTVARRLAIAPDTVKGHMKAILHKLEANNRTQAAAVAERRGLFKQPGTRIFA